MIRGEAAKLYTVASRRIIIEVDLARTVLDARRQLDVEIILRSAESEMVVVVHECCIRKQLAIEDVVERLWQAEAQYDAAPDATETNLARLVEPEINQ